MAEAGQNEPADEIKRRALKRLLVAVALIVLAIAALALIERWSAPKPIPEPIAEPTIAPPPALPESAPAIAEAVPESAPEATPPTSEAPPPPEVINNEKLTPPVRPHGLPKPAAQMESSAPPTTAKTEAPHGYILQLGVFASPANAEALQSKLAKAGIRSHTETRVHVGPFKDKTEAEQAMAKLRAMGMTPVIMPAR
ncbi:MAG: SPOR domain-containing protein [Pseudomonadota bacterium]